MPSGRLNTFFGNNSIRREQITPSSITSDKLDDTGVTAGTYGTVTVDAKGRVTGASQNPQLNSVGVGTAASTTAGEIRATNNITAYYSDERLKNISGKITDALAKVKSISGVNYKNNDLAKNLGYTDDSNQVGVLAQELLKILPECVKLAPFDTKYENGKEVSISGENYLTVQYEKIIPLLIEAIKELSLEIEKLKK
jgi:hypothetical protein